MFGFGEEFEYFKCVACGCLQLEQVPEDMSRYYKEGDYYSLKPPKAKPWLRQRLEALRDEFELTGTGILGRSLAKRFPSLTLRALRPLAPTRLDSILDVGCGAGVTLQTLARLGFRNAAGVEPFLEEEVPCRTGPHIYKCHLAEMDGLWRIVMFNHSFEHMSAPIQALVEAGRLLQRDGTCVVRIPVVDGYAWRTYGVAWYQIDAPRHLFLHSRRSMEIAAAKAGFRIDAVAYDSGAAQFWASEQYKIGIPLRDPRSYYASPRRSMFSRRRIAAFARLAEKLNASQDGDQAVFYLRRRGG